MRVLKFTGKAGPDMREGQGIIALFAHPVAFSSPRPETAAPAYPTVVPPACATFFCPPPLSHPSLPMIINLSVAGVISGNRSLPPPGALKKRDCFHLRKNHPDGRSPPASQNREVAEALLSGEVFRGLVGGRTRGGSADKLVHHGPAAVVPAVRRGRPETAPPAARALCGRSPPTHQGRGRGYPGWNQSGVGCPRARLDRDDGATLSTHKITLSDVISRNAHRQAF
jgi:hypothetical protein